MNRRPPQRGFPIRAFQWDLARQVERLDFLLKWLPRYAEWGYQELYLHLEDAVEYPSLPAVARPGAYTYPQLARLVQAATAVGIRVVPIVNLLGHTQYLIKVPGLRDLNELRDDAGRPRERGQLCPLHPRTPEVAESLLRDMAPFCTAGKVHVGLDESFHLGQCPRCRAEVARRGLAGHFAAYVSRLHQLTQSFGLRLGLWADMLALLPAAIPLLPREVIAYDWYYYPFARNPRVELHNFAEVDLAPSLQARGIEYWGCPMNGAFRYEPLPIFGERLENILSWWWRCRRVGAGGLLVTSWEANRLALELTAMVDAAAACLWLDPGIDDPPAMLRRGFERVFGPRSGAAAARAALAADAFPYSGYHRWQINDRWDVCAGRDGVLPYANERKALSRICRSVLLSVALAKEAACATTQRRLTLDKRAALSLSKAPAGACTALAASIAFRRYLAQRDVFVRRNAQAVFQFRREIVRRARLQSALGGQKRGLTYRATLVQLRQEAARFAATLRAGRVAARAMWDRSRNPQEQGPNELMLGRDADRLREWRVWLQRAGRNPEIIWGATPVCGAWQLQFTVHNFAPALQEVVVEQRQPDGSWRTLHGLHLVEFQAFAARPRSRIRREVSVPTGDPHTLLRLAVRGVGQVAISRVELTNGVTKLHVRGWPPAQRKLLGYPAPSRGFPMVDLGQNVEALLLKFRGPSWNFNPAKIDGRLLSS